MGRANPVPTRGPIIRRQLPRLTVSTAPGGTQMWGYNKTPVRQLDTGNRGFLLLSGEGVPASLSPAVPWEPGGNGFPWGVVLFWLGSPWSICFCGAQGRAGGGCTRSSPVQRSALNVKVLSTCNPHLIDQRWAPLSTFVGTCQEHGEPHSWAG